MLLVVLVAHAVLIALLVRRWDPQVRASSGQEADTAAISAYLQAIAAEDRLPLDLQLPVAEIPPPGPAPQLPVSGGEPSAITDTSDVDWPEEARQAAARVIASELEAERVAKMFAGPGGTWASLTKRQKSKLNKFRFKPGIDGLEYDAQGNQIFHISEGCVIVNSSFFACTIGKPKVRDDMFDNMRLYFDEQRLPPTDEGNGTEPEALRPPY